MTTATARLIKRDTEAGIGCINENVPLGKTYKVILESLAEGVYVNDKTGETVTAPMILASNSDGSYGFLPMECIKIEEKDQN